jgi:succinate dehydrogenase/fumarate reductase flavoprotein subunit
MSESYDVIICGFGGAGAAAAIEAHDAGAHVLILEKMDSGGGSTAEAGGTLATVVDPTGAVEHYAALTEGRTPRAVIEAHVAGIAELPRWIARCGGTVGGYEPESPKFPVIHDGTAYSNRPRADAIGRRLKVREPGVDHGGTTLWNLLRRNVETRLIEVRYASRGRRLIRETDGVTGIEVEASTGTTTVLHARRGVVLTCGGFAYRRDYLREHLGVELDALGPPGRNTGDGIDMALGVGAALWHLNAVATSFGYRFPGCDVGWMCAVHGLGFFLVDQRGRRFVNERNAETHAAKNILLVRDPLTGAFTRFPSYLILDEATRLAGPLASRKGGWNRQRPWSDDNSDEIAQGWIKRGDSLVKLGAELGLDPDVVDELESTAERFNHAARHGNDEFGRPRQEMAPLDALPFYGVPIIPVLLNTQGGPRRDAQARVVDTAGQVIPRLYSAGELGSMWAELYPGAGNVTEALVFGRIAGRNAAQLESIDK